MKTTSPEWAEHVLPIYSTCNSMKNLLSYCGLIDARITVSGKDLPVHYEKQFLKYQTKCEE